MYVCMHVSFVSHCFTFYIVYDDCCHFLIYHTVLYCIVLPYITSRSVLLRCTISYRRTLHPYIQACSAWTCKASQTWPGASAFVGERSEVLSRPVFQFQGLWLEFGV